MQGFLTECEFCIEPERTDRIFLDEDKFNFRPDSMAIVLDKGLPIPGIQRDILGAGRSATTPDLGCYEQ